MLTHIHIQNFTIVESLTLDFQKGLSVLTGETGAGKSIWIEAVSLALGTRADNNVIRHGQARCDITLCFDLTNQPDAQQWLKEQGYDDEDECIIRRTIHRDGPSRASISGHPCPLHQLREFSQFVLNIHGQHQHQTLLKRDVQQKHLDAYGKHEIMLRDIQKCYQHWYEINTQINELTQQAKSRDSELSLLRYQFEELNDLNLKENEWEELTHQHQQLHNAKDLMTQLNQAIELTVENEETSASTLLRQAVDRLNEIKFGDAQINVAKELLNTAAIHLQEAGDELHQYRNHLDLGPDRLATIEQRLTAIHDLARKHHVNPENLMETQKSIEQKLQQLDNVDLHVETLQKTQGNLLKQYKKTAEKISESRQKAAKKLNKTITKSIQDLGIEGGLFRVQFKTREEPIHPLGNESLQFEVSTNPGQPFQSLSKVVSGGELSRISLALQVMTSQKENTPTLIFDEVDTGIGGKTAETVGKLLQQLGNHAQVLCITHLPQVAAQGHHHYKVKKTSDGNTTMTQIKILNEKDRINELARMLSGSKITEQTLAHASELLKV